MRIGIACPYSFAVPGGVQFHVRDLAEELMRRGHEVSVLAPADEDTDLPDYVVPVGGAVAVPYNGSVARVSLGPIAGAKVRKWVDTGDFDLLHAHEPLNPSLGMQALWVADGPVVGTFHSSMERSRALQAVSPLLVPVMEKLTARIAVSEEARRTLVQHLGGDAVVVPNGVYVDTFATARKDPRWTGTPERPTIAFLGRLDDSRKGLPILAAAVPEVLARVPGARFLVAGRGDAVEERAALAQYGDAVEFLGGVSDEDKAALFASVDAYVAPQTGGESFGIVLVEAMSAGTLVVASDIPAFQAVLDGGRNGRLFRRGDGASLAATLVDALLDRDTTAALAAEGAVAARRYDWSTVAGQVLAVYEMAMSTEHARVRQDPRSRTVFGRLRAARTGDEESAWA